MSNRNGNSGKSSGPKKPTAKLGQKPRSNKAEEKPFAFETDDSPRLNSPRREKQSQPMNDMRLGEFTIDRMAHDGRGIALWNGKTLFVEGALTGERVSARLIQDHSRYAEARMDKLITESTDRVAPECAHYAECGGCQLQHLNTELQVAQKQTSVLEQLALWGGLTPKTVLAPIESESRAYRRCARLGVVYGKDLVGVKGVSYETDDIIFGFRKRNSKQLIQIDACTVLMPALNALLAPLNHWLAMVESVGAVTHIELIYTEQQTAVIVRHTQPLSASDLAQLQLLAAEQNCVVYLQGRDGHQLQDLSGKDIDPRLSYGLPAFDLTLDFHPLDFIQVNPTVNEKMVAQALALLALNGTERVLDLFCGIGNFTLPLAKHSAQVIGIEAVDTMVQRGRENAVKMGVKNVEFIAANLLTMTEHRMHQTCGKIDAVLLDPPRDGAKEIIDKLPQLSPKRIVYVSCNPATLARDAKVLAAAGYQLDSVGVLDMFPHTAHVESMALFVRR